VIDDDRVDRVDRVDFRGCERVVGGYGRNRVRR
jgi:hypothetical protein